MGIESYISVVMLRLSTKQKREVYSISNLLLHLIIFIALLISLNSCGLINREEEVEPATCNTFATLKDLRGLDGCGFVLVLDDGQRLEFELQTPRVNFNLADGKRVKVSYKESTRPSICMVGKTVEITCISEVNEAPAPAS
jgi:hypothetical protein